MALYLKVAAFLFDKGEGRFKLDPHSALPLISLKAKIRLLPSPPLLYQADYQEFSTLLHSAFALYNRGVIPIFRLWSSPIGPIGAKLDLLIRMVSVMIHKHLPSLPHKSKE